MKKIKILMLLMGLVMTACGKPLKSSLEGDSIKVSRSVAEGCLKCSIELKAVRDSLAVYKKIDVVQSETIDWIVADKEKKRFFAEWWDRNRRSFRAFGLGVGVGVMLVLIPHP